MDLSLGTKSTGTFEMFFSYFGPFQVWGVASHVTITKIEEYQAYIGLNQQAQFHLLKKFKAQ